VLGWAARSRAFCALELPFFAAACRVNLLADTIAISLIEKMPFSNIRKMIISISMIQMYSIEIYSIYRRESQVLVAAVKIDPVYEN
jgi:hypothetical protein